MTTQLYNLDKPDELGELDLMDADMYVIAQTIYNNWLPDLEEEIDDDYYEKHCGRAVNMLRPFKEKFKGEFDTGRMCFPVKQSNDDNYYKFRALTQLYVRALVEGTGIDKLVIGKSKDTGLFDIDFSDMKGKTLEIAPEGKIYNISIRNGTVLNRNEMHEAWADPKSTIVSFGSTWILGCYQNNGLYLNYGNAHSMGYKCGSGIFLNFGVVGTNDETALGYHCKGGVFVTSTKPAGGFLVEPEGPVYGVGPDELANDSELSILMDEAKSAGKIADVPKTKEIAREIDAHVRKNYQPRRVA